jgi:hypothetical protein
MTDQRKDRPTLRLHTTKEEIEKAQHLMDQAMHRYFEGRTFTVPTRPRLPPPATREWECLVAYAAEAHKIPSNPHRGVITVKDFKFVTKPPGVYIEADVTCPACEGWLEGRTCICPNSWQLSRLVDSNEPEEETATALLREIQSDIERIEQDTARAGGTLVQGFQDVVAKVRNDIMIYTELEQLAKERPKLKEAQKDILARLSQWKPAMQNALARRDAELAKTNTNPVKEERSDRRVKSTKKLSCLAPAFVPGNAAERHQPSKEVDWSWCPSPTDNLFGSYRYAQDGVDHYSHIRETADASYQPTVGELALPHCTFCKNSGEPYAVYRGHTVRGSTGEVECLKLLNIECLRCHQRGHTVSHCTAPPPPPPTPEQEDFYCQFCFTSGEDEFAYRSHNLRNADGTTNCQKLLNTKCRNCGKLGHTQRYCDQERKQRRPRFQRHRRAPSPPSPPDISNSREFPSLLPPPLAPDTPEPVFHSS